MPQATGRTDATRAVVFSPLDGAGRAELVEQRTHRRDRRGRAPRRRAPAERVGARAGASASPSSPPARRSSRFATRGSCATRRGRDGGSFVTHDRDAATRMIDERLRCAQPHRAARPRRCTTPRSPAWRPRSPPTARATTTSRASPRSTPAPISPPRAARRRAVGRFQLEIAAVSQSPRLVHEELRLQAESGPLLWLCLREQAYRDRSGRPGSR